MTTKDFNFDDYLYQRFCNNYTGLDDDLPDAHDKWREELDENDYIRHAETYAHECYIRGYKDGSDKAIKTMSESIKGDLK